MTKKTSKKESAPMPPAKAPRPTIKSLQEKIYQLNIDHSNSEILLASQRAEITKLKNLLEETIAESDLNYEDIKQIANDNAAIANQAVTEKSEYKRKYLLEVNKSWLTTTKERFLGLFKG